MKPEDFFPLSKSALPSMRRFTHRHPEEESLEMHLPNLIGWNFIKKFSEIRISIFCCTEKLKRGGGGGAERQASESDEKGNEARRFFFHFRNLPVPLMRRFTHRHPKENLWRGIFRILLVGFY
ncbi:hypothetical protein CEXT_118321 [Caerostris extrusa]|uniref:Uncharacterized protein n=1 Tax=Caerostris extrusa TaxID=172846 RepID=A0AAV4UFV4_CAEEX|nr:hypothetical protein CEXT_118321 [Caerostris extrusa]